MVVVGWNEAFLDVGDLVEPGLGEGKSLAVRAYHCFI